jgi:hypothetical protein
MWLEWIKQEINTKLCEKPPDKTKLGEEMRG